jgi:hypothetical protein
MRIDCEEDCRGYGMRMSIRKLSPQSARFGETVASACLCQLTQNFNLDIVSRTLPDMHSCLMQPPQYADQRVIVDVSRLMALCHACVDKL